MSPFLLINQKQKRMKKYFSILVLLSIGLMFTTACSSDNDDSVPQEVKNYLKVENATYTEGSIPQATVSEKPKVETASTVQKGGEAMIKVAKDRVYAKFFIGVKGVPGYWIYTPTATSSVTRAANEEEYYEIPFEVSGDSDGSVTIQVSGQTDTGDITQPYEQTINYVEGATVKLSSVSANGQTLMSLSYNPQGKVTSFYLYREGTRNISYDGNYISSITDDGIVYRVSQNEQGCISRMQGRGEGYSDNISFTYDGQGRLTHCSITGNDDGEPFSADHKLTWNEGKLIRSEHSSSDDDTNVFTYSYGQYENKFQQPFMLYTDADGFPVGIGLYGKGTTMLPIRATSGSTAYEYTYTFNEDKSIKTQRITRDDGRTVELTYAYE